MIMKKRKEKLNMANVITVANIKGGIGKSTTALALAGGLIKKGYKVLMIDAEAQRNTSVVYRAQIDNTATLADVLYDGYSARDAIQHTEYGDIIPGDENLKFADTTISESKDMYLRLKSAIKDLHKSYDYIIIDTPPHAGILLGNALMAVSGKNGGLIIPISTDLFGITGINDFAEIINEYKSDNKDLKVLGLLIIKYKYKQTLTNSIEDGLLPELAKFMDTKVFESKIRDCVKVQEAQTKRMSLFDYAPKCTSAIDYSNLINELLGE